uniref:Uncharacterized protein n=1 Tax=Arundo donax TaxID=35708 RepID=A0A0A9CEQ5_ARUDO
MAHPTAKVVPLTYLEPIWQSSQSSSQSDFMRSSAKW